MEDDDVRSLLDDVAASDVDEPPVDNVDVVDCSLEVADVDIREVETTADERSKDDENDEGV